MTRAKSSSLRIAAFAIIVAVFIPTAVHAWEPVPTDIDAHLQLPLGTYYVESSVTVQIGVTLTIAPGSVVKFANGTRLTINGSLYAEGSESLEIVFTSDKDDRYGEDVLGDGDSTPSASSWSGIFFTTNASTSPAHTQIDHCVILYAANGITTAKGDLEVTNTAIRWGNYGFKAEQGATPISLTDSVFSHHAQNGIYLYTSSVDVSYMIIGCTTANNGAAGIRTDGRYRTIDISVSQTLVTGNGGHGIQLDEYIYGPPSYAASLSDNIITDNGAYGIHRRLGSSGAASRLTGNVITGNGRPFRLPITMMPEAADLNTLVPNQIDVIELTGGTLETDLTIGKIGSGENEIRTYVFDSHQLTVQADSTLNIEPGVIFKLNGVSINVYGALVADGTAAEQIVFTSSQDDSVGGDTNGDGIQTSPEGGDWGSIQIYDSALEATNRLDHVLVRYGGTRQLLVSGADFPITHTSISAGSGDGIYISAAAPTVDNCSVFANAGDGIELAYSGSSTLPIITNSRVFGNQGYGVLVGGSSGPNPTLSSSEIFGNRLYGLQNNSSNTVIATGNFWGASDGPGGVGGGGGDEVSTGVDFSGFLTTGTEFNYLDVGGTLTEGFAIGSPLLTQGTESDEFGASEPETFAWHNDEVILGYTGLDPASEYRMAVTYVHKDSVTGGNVQQLLDGSGDLLARGMTLPRYTPSRYQFVVPPGAIEGGGDLTLRFDRMNGYRAVVNEVFLWKQGSVSDITAPTSSIISPIADQLIGGDTFILQAAANVPSDPSGVAVLEFSSDDGSSWEPATIVTTEGYARYLWTLPPDGDYLLATRAFDGAGNVESPAPALHVVVDNDAPQAVDDLTVFDTPSDMGGSISIGWTRSTDDGAGDNDVAHYLIYRTEYLDWVDPEIFPVAAGSESYADVSAVTGTWYFYKIRTVDHAGNWSETAGTARVRAIDNSIPDPVAPEDVTDLTAFEGDQQVLLNWTPSVNSEGDLVDQRLYVSTDSGTTWGSNPPNFNNGTHVSLGPTVTSHSVTGLVNGQEYYFKVTAVDDASNESTGTIVVATPNNTVTELSGNISADDTLLPGIYHVTSTVTVDAGVTLTVQGGAVFKFDAGTQLTVNGALAADGTPTSKVLFTSILDDFGGDTNGDGGTTMPAPGDWYGVTFNSGATAGSCLVDHVEIRYAGQGGSAGLQVSGIAFDITNTHIHDCADEGLYLTSGAGPTIADSTVEDCGGHGIYGTGHFLGSQIIRDNVVQDNGGHGVWMQRGGSAASPDTVTFTGNQIARNAEDGLRVQAYSSHPHFSWTVDNNSITDNDGYGMNWIWHSYYGTYNTGGPIHGNTITGNGKLIRTMANMLPEDGSNTITSTEPLNVWELIGNTIVNDRRLDVKGSGADRIDTYLISNRDLVVDTGTRLYVDPGVVVKFGPGRSLTVNGVLRIEGTEGNEPVFTSYRDDEFRGDTNGDGSSTPQPQDWGSIKFSSSSVGSLCLVDQAIVRYAGTAIQASVPLTVNASDLSRSNYGFSGTGTQTLVNSVFSDNHTDGINVSGGTGSVFTVSDCEMTGNGRRGLHVNPSSNATVELSVTDSIIDGNSDDGIHLYDQTSWPRNYDATISDNVITDNTGYGIYRVANGGGTAARLSGNTITGNRRPYRLPITMVPRAEDNNILAPNAQNVAEITGGSLEDALTLAPLDPGTAKELRVYVISGGVTVASGGDLSLAAGVILKLDAVSLTVSSGGKLSTNGVPGEPVVLTAHEDDFWAGDTNGNGTGDAPNPGDWASLTINSGALPSTLEGMVVRFGTSVKLYESGVNLVASDVSNMSSYGVYLSSYSGSVQDNRVWGNDGDGIQGVGSGAPTIVSNEISMNRGDGIRLATNLGNALVTGNELFANEEAGLNYTGSTVLNATANWWGDPAGPLAGDGLVGDSIDAGSHLTTGTIYAYTDLGGVTEEGYGLAGPTLVWGTSSQEFGTEPGRSMVFDIEQIGLQYTGLDPSHAYELRVAYWNNDNTTGQGGNVQAATAASIPVHGALRLPDTGDTVFHVFSLPADSYSGGDTQIGLERISGYRAVAQEIAVLDRGLRSDTFGPDSQITQPADGARLGGDLYTIRGNFDDAESGIWLVEVGIDDGHGILWRSASVGGQGTSGSWSYEWPLPPTGAFALYSRATDNAGNVETPGSAIRVTIDQSPPAPPTGLSATDHPGDAGGAIDLSWNLSRDDGSGENDAVRYDVYRTTLPGREYVYAGTAPAGTSVFLDHATTDGLAYYYVVDVFDAGGLSARSLEYGPISSYDNGIPDSVPPLDPASFSATAGDGLVELAWERSPDYFGDLADQRLYVSTDGGTTWGSNYPAYDNAASLGLGKETLTHQFSAVDNGTSYTFRLAMIDNVPNESAGLVQSATPQAGIYFSVSGTLDVDTRWHSGIYRVIGNLVVANEATLTIDPCVVVKFESGARLTVDGGLLALGNESCPVHFTSIHDDFGGDTNGDGGATLPASGDWYGLTFNGGATASSCLVDHVEIRYAGQGGSAGLQVSGIAFDITNTHIHDCADEGLYLTSGAGPTIADSTVEDCGGHGIYGTGHFLGSQIIRDNVVQDNGGHGVWMQRGGSAASPDTVTFTGNQIARNAEDGLRVQAYSSHPHFSWTVDNNSITDNDGYGMNWIWHSYYGTYNTGGPIHGNTITGNGKLIRTMANMLPEDGSNTITSTEPLNVWELIGNTIVNDRRLDVKGSGADRIDTYLISNRDLVVDTGTRLYVDPGVVVKFGPGRSLTVNGVLRIEGTEGNEPVFTSYRDDEFRGDTNGDGSSTPQPQDWGSIKFSSSSVGSLCLVDQAIVRYAGTAIQASVPLTVNASDLSRSNYGFSGTGTQTLVNSVFSDNHTDGINVSGGTGSVFTVSDCEMTGNGRRGLHVNPSSNATVELSVTDSIIDGNSDDGIHLYDQTSWPRNYDATISDNVITDNTGYGIYRVANGGGTAARLSGNTITGNRRPYRLPITMVPRAEDNNILTPNAQNVAEITGGSLDAELTLERISAGMPHELKTYVVAGSIAIGSGGRLSVAPGIYMKFHTGAGLTVNADGALSALGTETDPTVFTSWKDDAWGGDTDESGTTAAPRPGDWAYLRLNSGSLASGLDRCVVRFGTQVYLASDVADIRNSDISNMNSNGLYLYNFDGDVERNRIWGNIGDGIRTVGHGSPTIVGNEISMNRGDGVEFANGYAETVLTDNALFANEEFGIRYSGTPLLLARGNWWGDPTGAMAGDGVTGNVDVSDPLLTGPVYGYLDLGGSVEETWELALPTVLQGTPSTEFGSERVKSIVWHEEQVQIEFTELDPARNYELRVAYRNPDNVGPNGNVQTAQSVGGELVHEAIGLPSDNAAFHSTLLPPEAYDSANLELHLDRQQGFRAMASEIALIERGLFDDSGLPSSTITSPKDGDIVNGAVVEVGGSYTDGESGLAVIEIGIDDGSGIDWREATVSTGRSVRYWSYTWQNPQDGSYDLYSRATDTKGNVEVPTTPINVRIDNDLPRPPYDVHAVDVLADAGGVIRVNWQLSPDDGRLDNDITGYEIYRTESSGWNYVLTAFVAGGVTSILDSSTVDGTDYWYLVRVLDQAGNSTDSGEEGPVYSVDNMSLTDVIPPLDANGLTASPGYDFVAGSGTTYLQWAPGDDPDGDRYDQYLYVSRDGGLSYGSNSPNYNDGNAIAVAPHTCSYQVLGLGLGVSYRFKLTSIDLALNESVGVVADAMPTVDSFVTLEDTTLCGDAHWKRGVFYLPNGTTSPVGAMLEIDGGTVVKLGAGRALYIHGSIRAVGTPGMEVVFTSYKDDVAGGDTNGDGSATLPAPGDWSSLYIIPASPVGVDELEFVTQRYASHTRLSNADEISIGNSSFSKNSSQGIYMTGSEDVEIGSCSIQLNGGDGLYAQNPRRLRLEGGIVYGNTGDGVELYFNSYNDDNSRIEEVAILENGEHGVHAHGRYGYNYTYNGTIRDCLIQRNGAYGLYFGQYLYGTPSPITGNTVTENRRPARLLASALPDNSHGNTLAPNKTNILEMIGSTFTDDRVLEVLNPGTSSEVSVYGVPSGTLAVDYGVTVSLKPGITIKFQGGGLSVYGALDSQGTDDAPVTLTSWADDAHGGDTNEDAYNSTAQQGAWSGVTFQTSTIADLSLLDHTDILFGALKLYASIPVTNCTLASSNTYGVTISGASPTISNCDIWGHRNHGVYIVGGGIHPAITGSRIWSNGIGAFSATRYDGINIHSNVDGSILVIDDNEIFGNYEDGLDYDGTNLLTAQNNWWGDPGGPGGDGPGSGDEVYGNVDVSAHRTSGTPYSYRNFSTAAPHSEGSLPLPSITVGVESDEWDPTGLHPGRTMVWDDDEIEMNYTGLDLGTAYQLKLTYYNQDPVSPGNVTDMVGNMDTPIHNRKMHPAQSSPTQFLYDVPPDAYSGGNLALSIDHIEAGTSYRATLSEIWLIENGSVSLDVTEPSSSITDPAGPVEIPLAPYIIAGTAADDANPEASGLSRVEVGVFDEAGTIWYDVTTLASNGAWTFTWTPPDQGTYTLYSRAVDRGGNIETPGSGTGDIIVGTPPPYPAPTVSAIIPNSGANTAPNEVEVIGTGFLSGVAVRVADVFCLDPVVYSSGSGEPWIGCDVPGGMDPGTYDVKVINPDEQSFIKYSAYTVTGEVLGPLDPVAHAGLDQVIGEGSSVVFDADGSYDPNGGPLNYRWDFDDDGIYGSDDTDVFGQPSDGTGVTPSFGSFDEGIYIVGLEVEDADAQTATDSVTVTVQNLAPIGSILSSSTATVGAPKQLQSGATDPGGDPITYEWDVDDDGMFGTADDDAFGAPSDAVGQNPQIVFPTPGAHQISVRFTDDAASSSTASQYLLAATNYVASAGEDFSVGEGATAIFAASAFGGTPPYTFDWTFGDGSMGVGPTPAHVYADNLPGGAPYVAQVRAMDASGAVTFDSVSVAVLNVPPVADAGGPYTTAVDVPLVLDGSASTDISQADAASLTYEWDFDYTGSFTLDGSGVHPTTTYSTEDGHTIALRVLDKDSGLSAVATTTIDVVVADVRFTTGDGVDADAFRLELEGIFITVSDFSQAGQADLSVTLSDTLTGDDETITLAEVAPGSGLFRNAVPVSSVDSTTGIHENGSVETQYGNTIVATYVAVEDTATIAGRPPLADAGSDQEVDQEQTVFLDGNASSDPDGGALTFAWDFDYDGTNFDIDATGATTSTAYALPGAYVVALRVTDPDSDEGIDTLSVAVNNLAPAAHAGGPYTGLVGLPVVFDGSGSEDPGTQDVLTYEWDFDYVDTFTPTGNGPAPSNTYYTDGSFTVALRVSDQHGMAGPLDLATVTINGPLTASAGKAGDGDEGETIEFFGNATGGTPPYTYRWTFPPDGSTSTEKDPWHLFPDDGTFNVVLQVTDDAGATDDALLQISITNLDPVADAGGPYWSYTDVDLPFDATGSWDVSPLDVLTFDWDSNYDGSFNPECTGILNPECQQAVPGAYTVAVRARDDDGGESSDTSSLLVLASPIRFTDETWATVGGYCTLTEDVHAEVHDVSRDFDDMTLDVIEADVSNTTTGDVETVALTETGPATAVFQGTLILTDSATHTAQNGELEALRGDGFLLQYTDATNSNDSAAAIGFAITGSCEIELVFDPDGSSTLSWSGLSGSYEVRRSTDPAHATYDTFLPDGGASGTTFTDPDVPAGSTAFFYLIENQ